MPSGMRVDTSINRSVTSWRAKYTSVASVNTRVMMDSPLLLSERISSSPGRPVIAISSGTVTKRSISSGERPGASVAICTCTLVTSGKASTDSFIAARTPKPHTISDRTTTTSRWLSAARIMDAIMGLLQFGALALVVQVESPFHDDGRALVEPADDRTHAVAGRAEFDRRQAESVGGPLHEDVGAVVVA